MKMAGWDVTVLSAALSLVIGIIWALAKLILNGPGSAREEMDRPEELLEPQPELSLASLQGND